MTSTFTESYKMFRFSTTRMYFMVLLISLVSFSQIFAQTGKITGKVVDAEFGDGMIGANVFIDGTNFGAATDIEGNYVINAIPAGTYKVVYSMIGFQKKTVSEVVVKAGEITKINITLSTETYETDEVVITAKLVTDSEASLLIKRQKSISVSDAISAEQISRSGSGNAADAVKQVVGASVVDGKYVYVRGLGERYSSTQLNGAELPSSDPDKKAFQLDLLPSGLLENITTIKTFTPDKPGNFSGGIVDIGTKNFPEKFQFKLSMGSSYNSNTTGNENYLRYDGSDTDWLGYDDGTRDLPAELQGDVNIYNPVIARRDSAKAYEMDSYAKSFNNTMDFTRKAAPINRSFSLSVGDNISTGQNSSFGYQASLTYSRSFSFYEDGISNRYSKSGPNVLSLNPELLANDSKGTDEANIGGLFAFAYNFNPAHQIGGNVFYTNSGESVTRYQVFKWPHQFGLGDDKTHYNRVLGYKERDIVSYQFRGDHFFKSVNETKLEWSASVAKTTQDEPDLRFIYYSEEERNGNLQYNIVGSNIDDPSRYFRSLEDNSNIYKADVTTPFKQWSGLKSKFKFGGYYQFADRSFNENLYTYQIANNTVLNEVNGDLTDFFSSQYAGVVGQNPDNNQYLFGNLIVDDTKAKNSYESETDISAFYMMVEMPIFNRFKFIGGARMEKTKMSVESKDVTKGIALIEEDDILPSINLIYNLTENMNFRAAATKTLARPNPRELAPFSAKQFIGDYELSGNPNLQRTLIANYDLRYEYFMRPGEIIAVSLFYKEMDNPIEIGMPKGSTVANLIYQYLNVDKAILKGVEFELRTKLDFIHEWLSDFQLGANLSMVDSRIDIPQDEFEARQAIDSTTSKIRDLQGQSELIANLDLAYVSYETGTSVNLHLNYFSERLARVSAGVTPDIYEQPAPRLDFTASQDLFFNLSVKVGVNNILDPDIKYTYDFDGEEYLYSSYKKGVTYKFGLSYKL